MASNPPDPGQVADAFALLGIEWGSSQGEFVDMGSGGVSDLPDPTVLFDVDEYEGHAENVEVFIMTGAAPGLQVCCGYIGKDRSRFCCNPTGFESNYTCGVVSHTKKAPVQEGYAYVRAPGKRMAAFINPSVFVDKIPMELRGTLMGSKPVSAWALLLSTYLELGDEATLQTVSELEVEPSYGPTPKKRKVRVTEPGEKRAKLFSKEEIFAMKAPEASPGGEGAPPPQVIGGAKWNVLIDMMDRAGEQGDELVEDVMEANSKISRLHVTIGTRPDNRHLPAVNIWDCVAENTSMCARMEKERPSGTASVSSASMDKLRKDVSSVETDLKFLRTTQSSIRTALGGIASKVNQGSSAPVIGAPVIQPSTTTSQSDIFARLADAEQELTRIKSTMGGDAVQIGSTPHHHPHDVSHWLTGQVPGGDFIELSYDVVSMFEVLGDTSTSTDDKMDSQARAKKGGHKSLREARIVNSFSTVVPARFQSSKTSQEYFSAIPTFQAWDHQDGINGFVPKSMKDMDRWSEQMTKHIDARFDASAKGPANALATKLRNDSILFWQKLSQWITTFYTRLIHKAATAPMGTSSVEVKEHESNLKETRRESWELMIKVLTEIFQELGDRRATGAAAEGESDPIQKSAMILYGTLRAHKFMNELVSRGFERHPALAPTFNTFLFTQRASFADILRVETKANSQIAHGNGLQKLLDSLASRVKKLEK
jgi:hypothetical protein